jgi:hypothetical protein
MHTMQLVQRYTSGEELWVCNDCERKIAVTWKPTWKRTVIFEGNDSIAHTGSSGGMSMEALDVTKFLPDLTERI